MYGLSEFNFSYLSKWFQVVDAKLDTAAIMIAGLLTDQGRIRKEIGSRSIHQQRVSRPLISPTPLAWIAFPWFLFFSFAHDNGLAPKVSAIELLDGFTGGFLSFHFHKPESFA